MKLIDKYLQAYGVLVGRLLLGFLFVFSGVGIVMSGIENFSGMIEMKGLPFAILLAWLVVALKIIAGAALMLGYKTREASLALLAFTIVTTGLYHADLQDINLVKNLAIIGGLLYAYVYGPGSGWRLNVGEKQTPPPSSPDQPTMTI